MTQGGKARRPKGTGSVYVRDGVVIGQYEVRTPDGGIRRRYVRCKDNKEVAGRLTKAIADRDSGLAYDSGKTTVGEYLDGWLDAIRGRLREKTWRRHEEIARIHVKPALGKTRLDGLHALQVQSLYRSLVRLPEASLTRKQQQARPPEHPHLASSRFCLLHDV